MRGEVVRTRLPAPSLPPGRPRLVVTGFMGTGKTEAGRRVAALLGLPFVDLDEVVERRAGMPIAAIFDESGEAAFRALERDAVADAARLSGTVVATGGGAPLDVPSFDRLSDGAAVTVLSAAPGDILRRLGSAADRPLLQPHPERRVAELLEARAEAYGRLGEPLDTTGRSPEEIARDLAARWPGAALVRIEVQSPDGTYPVVVGEGGVDALGEEVRRLLPDATRAAVLVDEDVRTLAGDRVAATLDAAGIPPEVVPLPPGEAGKTSDTLTALWGALHRLGLDRGDPVVAVGGGAALDAAGFAAATYARGLPLVNVPTTLLAMVDASVGGKVAIDHAGIKNLVGAFHHPRLVVADPALLATLPARPLRAGLAEIVKVGIAASPLVLDVLEAAPLDGDGIPRPLSWLVEQAVRIKAAYVGADPGDRGLRHALNLGHTFAHAIESASGYEVLHGEAVAVGLVAAARVGASIGACDPGLGERVEALLARLGLPTTPPAGLDPGRMAAAMGSDKKRRGGRLVLVVPSSGGVDLVRGIDAEEAVSVLFAGSAPTVR